MANKRHKEMSDFETNKVNLMEVIQNIIYHK